MGGAIAGSAWLLELGAQGDSHARVSRLLLRMQVVTERRTGHRVDLDNHQARHAIAHAARWGHVADYEARCLHCNCSARLNDWCKVAALTVPEHRQVAREASWSHRPWDFLYLQGCPRAELARYLAESGLAPEGLHYREILP